MRVHFGSNKLLTYLLTGNELITSQVNTELNCLISVVAALSVSL